MIYSDPEINTYIKDILEKRLFSYGSLKYGYAIVNKRDTSQMSVITNIPDWADVYFENDYQNIDPVIITALNRLSCFTWDESLTINDRWKLPKIFNRGKSYNIISGYTFVLHDQYDNLVLLSIMVDKITESDLYASINDNKVYIQYLLIEVHELLLHAYKNKFEDGKSSQTFSHREKEVFDLCCSGKSYPEIAKTLNITVSTVKYHMKNVVNKLGVKNAKHAIALRSDLRSPMSDGK